ncbi:DUF4352 domain-containing protein [Nocardia barduliensis]|uniref:DUF4352 domain-containing protein n=1 Tax=Nocardia barduliensis TaxID=2736643 RepID=UPI0028A93627|nr:DUF4352 domain-containing protein [Nocardia barduliensis]
MSQPPPYPGPNTGPNNPAPGTPPPGYQQPGFPPPPGYGPPQPRKKRVVWPWVIIGAIVLLCGGCFGIVGLADNDSKSADGTNQPAPGTPKAGKDVASAGSAVRDGKFEFVVTAIDPPTKTIGENQFLRSTAQGEYIVIHVDVSNIGNEPRSYFGSNQKLYDDQGREFTNDTKAEINVNEHLSADINPGNRVSMRIVFDVPPGSVPAVLELHDSMLSGGVKVALR